MFFFVPQFPVQYRWNPRKLIDIGLYESHYLDSDYGEGEAELPYHLSPFFASSSLFFDQKIQAELGRTDDSFEVMLSLDYAADPDSLPRDHPEIYGDAIASSLQSYGRVPLITTRLVDATPTLDPRAADARRRRGAPLGQHDGGVLRPAARGAAALHGRGLRGHAGAKPPRVGVQKAIPGDGQVTLRWDVALDQTLPVRYNIYYSEVWPFDLGQAQVLTNVPTEVGADYVERSLTSADDGCPYQSTVTGLENGRTYYFLVRAEDSTPGTPGDQGRGPGRGPGGREPEPAGGDPARAPTPARAAIAIDGNFDDWEAVAGLPRRARAEAASSGPTGSRPASPRTPTATTSSTRRCRPIEPAAGLPDLHQRRRPQLDRPAHAGAAPTSRCAAGSCCATRAAGLDDTWTTVATVELARNGGRVELRLPRAALAASGEGPVFSFLGVRTGAPPTPCPTRARASSGRFRRAAP